MPELPMRFHPLGPGVKCPACGGDLVFVRVRLLADLYQCASDGRCKRQVLHYRNKDTQTCGYGIARRLTVYAVLCLSGWNLPPST
jgi:ssDNA-binding Zn-finger/Zn-ribbon topoisomerase 1